MFDASSRFLIVDDSDECRKTVKSALTELGFRKIDQVTNGQAGLVKIEDSVKDLAPYSLVLCDVNMPKMNGLELLEQCKKKKDLQTVPFLMITTDTQKEVVLQAVMKGVSGYIVKPFEVDELVGKIKEIIQKVGYNVESPV